MSSSGKKDERRVSASETDRLFSCASPLGEAYVGASRVGVRLLCRGLSCEEFARRYRERYGRIPSWAVESTDRLAERVSAILFGEEVDVRVRFTATAFDRVVVA